MSLYKGEKLIAGAIDTMPGKQTILYDNSAATPQVGGSTYQMTDDVNNYDYVIFTASQSTLSYRQCFLLDKYSIANSTSKARMWILVFGYAENADYIDGYFINDKFVITNRRNFDILQIVGVKLGVISNVIENPAPEQSYSTEETLTGGTWIDGKPIYRKVFTGAFALTSSWTTIGTIQNVADVIDANSLGKETSGNSFPGSQHPYVRNNNSTIQLYSGNWSFTATKVIVEYTKTTD